MVTVLMLKAGVLVLDTTVRLYLGDSAAYLAGAHDDRWLPTDRSFTYSLFLDWLIMPTGRLHHLLLWQALAGTGVAWLLWHTLTRRLGVGRSAAAIAACLLAVEPAQLYLERMVMAETLGLCAFVACVAAACAYVASSRAAWLPVVAGLGVVAVSFRTGYLPVVLVVSAGLPLLWLVSQGGPRWRRTVTHGLIALCSVFAVHQGYRQWVGMLFEIPPTYLPRAGFMQLGLVAPLITPEHLVRVGLPADFEQTLRFPLGDRRARMAHMWEPGGLTRALRSRGVPVEDVARPLARMALRDNPWGLVPMGLDTVGDYFRADSIQHGLDNDLGRREIPPDLLRALRERWGYEADGLPTRVTPVSAWYEHAHWWLVSCLLVLVPVGVAHAVVAWGTPHRLTAVLLALVSLGLVVSHVLFVNVALFRYLQPLPFFVLLHVAALVRPERRQWRMQRQASGVSSAAARRSDSTMSA